MEDLDDGSTNKKPWPLLSRGDFLSTQMENWVHKDSPFPLAVVAGSNRLESISEETVATDKKHDLLTNFIPTLRSGEWSDIGGRPYMEDTHILFPSMVSLLVANAGDSRAVLSRCGTAIEMSKDHRPCCMKERRRIESLGGFIDDGYLNGQLGVTRALGNWHLEGMKEMGERIGPLSAEPELKMITLTKEDEFLIIGSDGIWDVFTSQNAVDFTRRRLQEHNDVKLCCREMVGEAIKRGATDNLTVVLVSFHLEPPLPSIIQRARFRRSISAEGLQSLKCLLEG
ncbi:hypothetical protein F383_03825 [Gossypium arboreum]|uniref:PPM-type phosphatase domain-containing protein n=1 Tax=Gossypium arboreum TaxID=29729 RepID=A0A0B0PD65_GOSAR|nr:hypothetical protein F383_03825 [Gossypium arboreum]